MSESVPPTGRGQLSLSVVEAGVGVLLVVAVTATFGLALPDTGAREAQLDTYAADATTILVTEAPRHGGTTRLDELASRDRFARERGALERRVERILPENLLYRLHTPHGSVGHPVPDHVVVGRATVPTAEGDVTLRVWFV